jgi:hypothetical protein
MDQLDVNQIPKIQVMIRKRPLTKKELKKSEKDIVEVEECTVVVNEKK